jgi:hypothetical protein
MEGNRMDLKTAVATILSTAGLMTGVGAEAKETTTTTKKVGAGVVKEHPLKRHIGTIVMRYGIPPVIINNGKQAELEKMKSEIQAALNAISTPDGQRFAKEAGLKASKIAEAKASLQKLESALQKLKNPQ